jgi:hypothetical protein
MSFSGRAKYNFTSEHLASAEYFLGQMVKCENNVEHADQSEIFGPRERNFYWRAVIIFSTNSLEAFIYDLLTDEYNGVLTQLNKDQRSNQIELIERKSALEKFGFAYLLSTGRKLDSGKEPAQSIKNIFKLRNEIVHYKSEWRDEANVSISLEKKFRGKFELNNFKTSELFFPDKCVSISSANWAIEKVKFFIKWFSSEINKKCPI